MASSSLEGTLGKISSAIYVTSGSSATVDSVRLENMEGPSNCLYENTGVIVG